MNFQTSTKRFLGILALIIVVSLILMLGFLYIIRNKIQAVVKYETQTGEKTTLEENNRALRQLVATHQRDIDRLISRVVATDGTVSFIDTVESYARTYGARISVENAVVDKAANETYQLLTLNIKTSGSWSSVYRFISSLESLPYKITINRLEIHHAAASGGEGWDGTMTLSVLQYK